MPNGSSRRVFADSNIWLYAFIQREDEQEKSRIADRLIRQNRLIISTQVVNEVCSNLLRKAEYTEEQIKRLIEAFYPEHEVNTLDQKTFRQASQLRSAYSLSYWDSIIVASALIANATVLLTEDMHDGLIVDGQLTIINPFASIDDQ